MNRPNEFVIVGDLHGKIKALQAIEKLGKHMIFLGDFVDSFKESRDDQARVVKRVLELTKEGKAEFILGNHELSYIDYRRWRCSGFDYDMFVRMGQFTEDLWNLGKVYIHIEPNIMITHAGLSKQIWDTYADIDEYDLTLSSQIERITYQMDRDKNTRHSWLYMAGRARGGGMPVGGPFWCDWNAEFVPVPGLIQIVGHTANFGVPMNFKQTEMSGLRRSPNGDWCIDCIDLEYNDTVLWYNNGLLSPLVFV